jgi:hypothetical protein
MYFFTMAVFMWAYRIISGLLILLLLLGTIGPIANIKILQEDHDVFHYQKIQNERSDILLSFLPVYNIFLWYKLHDFEHPYWWAKESILRWTLFALVTLVTKSDVGATVVIMMIIIRVASLLSGIDILDPHVKKKISMLFKENSEEIRAYPRATIIFWIKKIQGKPNTNFNNILKQEQEQLQHLIKTTDRSIIAQYTIALLLLIGWLFMGSDL